MQSDPPTPGQLRLPATVVVTRPQREAGVWVRGLQAHGLSAIGLPLMAFGPPANPQTLTRAWQTWRDYSALMFVSPQAVHAFFEAGAHENYQLNVPVPLVFNGLFAAKKVLASPSLDGNSPVSCRASGPAGDWAGGSAGALADSAGLGCALRCWAPGPGTAAALRHWGVPSGCIDQPPSDAAQFDSEALWPAVRDQMRPGARVLVVRGEVEGGAQSTPLEPTLNSGNSNVQGAGQGSGRDWLARQCEAAGAEVHWCVAYRRQAPQWTADQFAQAQRAAADGSVWLISSSESLVHLRHLLPGVDWQASTALVTHPRIALAVQALGFGRVWQSRPALADVAQALWPHPP